MNITSTLLRLAVLAAAFVALPSGAEAQFQRVVLIEEYTSVTCQSCAKAGKNVNDILALYPTRTVSIRYHTNFIPSPKDRFYEANRIENEARKVFYGWQAMPVLRIDGEYEPPATDMTEVQARVEQQLALESPVRIDVTQVEFETNWRRVTVEVTAGPDGLPEGYHLRTVAVESLVHDPLFANSPYNGEVDVRDIMRRFMPNTDGDAISLGPNETKTFTYTYTIDETWQADQMYTVAFVQDDFTKAVVQTGYSARPISAVESPELAGYSARAAAPNPTAGDVRISYTLGRTGPLDVQVIDASGRVVRSVDAGVRDAGSGTLTLELGDLPAGAYTCVMSSGAWRWSERVVVVR